MTVGLLQSRLEPVARRRRQLRFWRRLAMGWAVAAGLAFAVYFIQRALGWASVLSLPIMALVGTVVAVIVAARGAAKEDGLREAARDVESRHPELDGLLLTAIQQKAPTPDDFGYLQRRILRDAVAHSREHDWTSVVPGASMTKAQFAQLATLLVFIVGLLLLRTPGNPLRSPLLVRTSGLTVSPGDASVERGDNLVVLARFGGTAPEAAELVLGDTPATERRIPLTRSLSDPVFGVTVPNVEQDFVYRVEYGGRRSSDYKVTVFEYPRLERSDAQLTFPEYTRQEARRIEDTRRVTAVEGTRLDLSLQLNKTVQTATLLPRAAGGEAIPLAVATNRAAAELSDFTLLQKGTYELQLVDGDGRTNKVPTQFVFEVLPNRTPELKLVTPRGDLRPSPLEEIQFEGTVWDDFGVLAHGLGYTLAGGEQRVIELGHEVPASERRPFQYLLRLESLGLQPDQLLSWYLWADDIAPDGTIRRTAGDLYFAEIRPFEEIFREGSGQEQEQQGEQGGQQSPSQELVRLQKQIVSATWKLQRDTRAVSPEYSKDADVVRQSQAQALEKAEAAGENGGGSQTQALLDAVVEDMSKAVVHLGEAEKSLAALGPALAAEQAAYQGLLKLQARETEVTRSRRGGGGGGEGANQRQLDQLELTQDENRYETQRQAQAPTTPERREQLQVLNRLQELARRQEDLNQRLKELQTALQEAPTEKEREEIRRQLKRLEEEQREMLADLDELQQRTQRPENQAQMSDLRRQLEQTREDMRRASEATEGGEVSQALAAGTRAQRQLQSMRDELRKKNSSEFAEELREMRADARELERQQQEIAKDLKESPRAERPQSLGAAEDPEKMIERLAAQKERLTNLIERATALSQAAETSEPLVAEHLYETLRQLNQDESRTVQELQKELIERGRMTRGLYDKLREDAGKESAKALEATLDMLREGYENEAANLAERAQANLESVRKGVERAAESVLGDDTAALQLARDELQALSEQLERELAQTGGGQGSPDSTNQLASAAGGSSGQPRASEGSNEHQAQGGAGENGEPGQESRQLASQDPSASGASPGQQGSEQQGGNQGQRSETPGGQGENGEGGQGQQPGPRPGSGAQTGQAMAGPQAPRGGNQPNPGGNRPGGLAAGRDGRGSENGNDRQAGPGAPGSLNLEDLLGDGGTGASETGTGPITTEAYAPWSDRLREVEELLDSPDMRNQVANARERARLERLGLRRDRKKPDWAVVRLEVLKPLVEVRRELDAELARRAAENPLLPIDRDPVPTRFSELVRRYYEELGKDRN